MSREEQIEAKCNELKELLLQKNRSYGDSALDPLRVFSRADPVEQLLVRIDDKLSRIARGRAEDGIQEDTVMDLAGYLVLLMIATEEPEDDDEDEDEDADDDDEGFDADSCKCSQCEEFRARKAHTIPDDEYRIKSVEVQRGKIEDETIRATIKVEPVWMRGTACKSEDRERVETTLFEEYARSQLAKGIAIPDDQLPPSWSEERRLEWRLKHSPIIGSQRNPEDV
ncbi:MAG: hypothetical protein EOM24_04185 [Chloroflexia bacterium]|nr:hypothetical protein [Chloroflexia bacterium]